MSKNEVEFTGEDEVLGEGWWASVMEDDRYDTTVAQTEIKSEPQTGESGSHPDGEENVDWNHVMQMFDHEILINGTVIDFNKGGLLVRAENLEGFVPVFHLDGVPLLAGTHSGYYYHLITSV